MPTITLNKTVFEKLVGKKLPLEELKDRISMLGTDLEKIEGDEIHVEVFPNRPDMLSEQGFARAFSSFIGVKTGLREYTINKSSYTVKVDPSVDGIRPYTACAVVKNLKFDAEKIREIIQIQEKLHVTYGRNRKKAAIGMYPLDKITFPITFKADKPERISFWPLEASKQMTGTQILQEHKAGKEFGHLLAGLPRYPFFIDAEHEILSMPPIINSHHTGRVTEQTKDLFIECSGFDLAVLSTCLNMIVTALADMGGEIYEVQVEYAKKKINTPNVTPGSMKLDVAYVNQRLGLNLTKKSAVKLLSRMGYGYKQGKVRIPAYRADILHPVDLVEDIAIAYGYEHFEEIIPHVSTIGEEAPLEQFARKVRELLVGLQFMEVKNYHLITKEELNEKMNVQEKVIPLQNAVGEYNHLRTKLLPSGLKNLGENQHNEYPHAIFEIGRAFGYNTHSETGIEEREKLMCLICHEKTDFTQIRQVLDVLMNLLGVNCRVKESVHGSFIAGRVGEIYIDTHKIGIIGEIHPQVLTNWNIMNPVVGLELDLEKLWELVE